MDVEGDGEGNMTVQERVCMRESVFVEAGKDDDAVGVWVGRHVLEGRNAAEAAKVGERTKAVDTVKRFEGQNGPDEMMVRDGGNSAVFTNRFEWNAGESAMRLVGPKTLDAVALGVRVCGKQMSQSPGWS
jgi:hypothetical protein